MEKPSFDTAKAGAMRFNTDSSQLEIYDGNQWTGILATSPELHTGGTRGIQAGGGTSQIEFINVESTSDTTSFGDLYASISGMGVASSRTRMLFAGRYSGTTEYNGISYITVASQGDATDFGDLTTVRGRLTGGASSTRALFAGKGKDPGSASNVIDFVTIAALGNAVDFGDLTVARSRLGAFGSPTRLVVCAGYNYSPGEVNTIDYVTISTQGNAADFGDFSQALHWNASACNAAVSYTHLTLPTILLV